MWAYPSDRSAKTKMREVFKDYQLALNKAKKLKKFVEEEFEAEKMLDKMLSPILPSGEQVDWQEELSELDEI